MDPVTTPGFYNGRFHQGGQGTLDERRGVEVNDAPDLDKMSKDDLVALAKDRGVPHDAGATKAQIIEALRSAEAG